RTSGQCRSDEEMVQRPAAPVEVAADVVRVVGLERGRTHRVAGHHDVAETGSEPLDLRLDRVGPRRGRAVRDVAVGPGRVVPPSTTGQPTWCANIPRNKPYPAVPGASSGNAACAARPATRARVLSCSKR